MCFSKQKVRDSCRNSQHVVQDRETNSTRTSSSAGSQIQAHENGSKGLEENGTSIAQKLSQDSVPSSSKTKFKQANFTITNFQFKDQVFYNVNHFQVLFHKHDTEDLGIAILGGHEYGLPIMISEIFPDSAVSRCAKISAGDM